MPPPTAPVVFDGALFFPDLIPQARKVRRRIKRHHAMQRLRRLGLRSLGRATPRERRARRQTTHVARSTSSSDPGDEGPSPRTAVLTYGSLTADRRGETSYALAAWLTVSTAWECAWLPGHGDTETAAAPAATVLPQDEWIAGAF